MKIFKKLIQVGFVSRELERIMDSYINIYGIGPWYYLKFCPDNVASMEFYGKKKGHSFNVAVCPIGDVRFEYIEPITESIYTDFNESRGEDVIHHLKFDVSSYKEAMDFMRSKNIELIQRGHQLGDEGKNMYNFFETTNNFGFVTEIVNVTENFIKPQPEKWVDSEQSEYNPVFTRPSAVGVVVKNLEEKIKSYTGFDIGPWEIHDFGNDDGLGFEAKIAFCKFGNITFKLIEPQSDSIFSETLQEHGEVIHHIKMEVDNYEEKLNYFRSKGIEILESGNYMDRINYAFLDTKKHLNFTVQISDINLRDDLETGKSESGIIVHP